MTAPHINPSGRSAAAKLANSQLSDQLEALGDIDLVELNLLAGGRKFPVRDRLVDGTITRTTLGASSLSIVVNDHDRKLIRSGIFGEALTLVQDANVTALGQQVEFNPVDVEIDGLYFRVIAASLPTVGDTLTLTCEDREVSFLRSYPKAGDPQTYHQFVPPSAWDRIRVMRYLIGQVTELVTPIRIVSPMLEGSGPIQTARDKPSQVVKGVLHAPGFPKGDSGVTVKGAKASAAQVAALTDILDVGGSLGVSRKLLVVAVMTATQESDADKTQVNGTHIGVFQQDSSPKSAWVKLGGATGTDVSADAHAFFTVAIPAAKADPGADYYQLAEDVQHSGRGELYAQWRDEAENTVSIWLGSDQANPNVNATATTLSSGFFYRGSEKIVGATVVQVRENNWVMLQRLANEVGWSCYCVSGTIYIEPDKYETSGAIRFQFSEETDGVDAIGFDINTSRSSAKATVQAHAKRWTAPPGSICQLTDMGPANGRWFVQTIQRSLFSDVATISLAKPQPTLLDAESATPIQATQYAISGSGGRTNLTPAAPTAPSRSTIVAAAMKAVGLEKSLGYYMYLQARPMPFSLFDQKVLPVPVDCSAFATLVYKAAGVPDPNGSGYDGSGYTGTLWANGVQVIKPSPGDLVFYGYMGANNTGAPEHVAVFIGNGQIVNMGSPNSGEPKVMAVDSIPLPIRGYRSYLVTGV